MKMSSEMKNALMDNGDAQNYFSNLSKTQRQEIIDGASNIKDTNEMFLYVKNITKFM